VVVVEESTSPLAPVHVPVLILLLGIWFPGYQWTTARRAARSQTIPPRDVPHAQDTEVESSAQLTRLSGELGDYFRSDDR
jgi:hypothetical protein